MAMHVDYVALANASGVDEGVGVVQGWVGSVVDSEAIPSTLSRG